MKHFGCFASSSRAMKWSIAMVIVTSAFILVHQYNAGAKVVSNMTPRSASQDDWDDSSNSTVFPIHGSIQYCIEPKTSNKGNKGNKGGKGNKGKSHKPISTMARNSTSAQGERSGGNENQPEASSVGQEVHNVVFVKVHKAASTTMTNMLHRFGVSRRLNIMVPLQKHLLNEWYHTINKNQILPVPKGQRYNIICNHLIFNEEEIKRFVPASTKFIGILREPFSQFTSAFYFYALTYHDKRYHRVIRDNPSNPIHAMLSDPARYDTGLANYSYTNNRMSVDFGFPVMQIEASRHNPAKIRNFVNYIDKTFHFIVIVEMFDESLVLLRRKFNWKTKDILYFKANSRGKHKDWDPKYTARATNGADKELHKKWSPIDHALYNHFHKKLLKEIESESLDFHQELVSFRDINSRVVDFCEKTKDSSATLNESLGIEAKPWNAGFCVTHEDCRRLMMNEMDVTHLARLWQTEKLKVATQRLKTNE